MKSIFLFLIFSCNGSEVHDPPLIDMRILTGAERTTEYFDSLQGKKVGVVGNQSSLILNTHLVDSLLAANIDVVKVFSPEHGFRGDADAGEHVKTTVDEKTGVPLFSLYGSSKKPSKESLKGIEIMIFDLQDVGVRFYTYISTLHYVMEACAESNIPLIILDRPNPNGNYVDGPVLDPRFKSFVGMHPVPIVHGMTIGEYGQMINGEGWLKAGVKCDLIVVPCSNYSHDSWYHLPVAPSPNLRTDNAIQLYPSLCLLEATTVSVGRGTEHPFEVYGHPSFPELPYSFTPKPGYGSKNPKHNGQLCYAVNLSDSINEWNSRMDKLNLDFLVHANVLLKGKLFVDREKFFNLLAGNDILVKQLTEGMSEADIRATWQEDLTAFKLTREKYLIYD